MDAQRIKRQQFLKGLDAPLTFGFAAALDAGSHVGAEYLAGIMQATADYGVHFINMTTTVRHSVVENASVAQQFVTKTQFMRAPLLDGLVTWASSFADYMESEKIRSLFASLAPLPLVDIGYLDISGVPSIRMDNARALHLLIDHLVRVHGFRSLVFAGVAGMPPHRERMAWFRRELAAFALPCTDDQLFLSDSSDSADIARVAERLAPHIAHIDAIVAADDRIAACIIDELEKRGIAVPDAVAVTGCNNHPAGITARTPVTTIDPTYALCGYRAVEVLIDRSMEPHPGTFAPLLVPPALLVRQSCGCFERVIEDSLRPVAVPRSVPAYHAPIADIRAYLEQAVGAVLPQEEKKSRGALAEAILADIYDTNVPPPRNILSFFRALLKKRHTPAFRAYNGNAAISALRNIVLPLVRANPDQTARFENTCHALRVLHTLSLDYDILSQERGESSALTAFALHMTAATSLKQVENVLRFKLSELSVPGIVLALSPYLTTELAPVHINLITPRPTAEVEKQLPLSVREPKLLPKIVFPRGKRFSVTLELLFYNAKYLGYAYVSNGAEPLAHYDDIADLLSQTLYKIYVQENRTKAHMLVITDREKLAKTISLQPADQAESHGRVQTQDILDYLIDHLDEMLTLEKMAADFHLSKSHLARRIKALTGYSMQTLHELLKMEQAKDLIKSGTLKMNDISARLGYTNPNYFSNVFKKVTGLSPLNWADRHENQREAVRQRKPLRP